MRCHVTQLPGGLVLMCESVDEEPAASHRKPRTTQERITALRASEKRLRDKRRGRRSVAQLQRDARQRRAARRTRNNAHSMKRVRVWQGLRRWERRPKIRKEDRHQVGGLLEELTWKDVYPKHLREFAGLRPEHRELLGWVVLMCCMRGALAVEGTRKQWALLLGCCARTAWTYLEDLCELKWIEKLEDFLPSESTGRDGEKLKHRQLANLYRPGRLLREAWDRHEQTSSVEKFKKSSEAPSSPTRGNFCHPSGRALPEATDPIAPSGIDSKVSASPTADPKPPSGAAESASPTEVGEPTIGRQADSTEIKFRATDGKAAAVEAPAPLAAPEVSAAPVIAEAPVAAPAPSSAELERERQRLSTRRSRGKRAGRGWVQERNPTELPTPVFVSDLEWLAGGGAALDAGVDPLERTEREERQREAQRLLQAHQAARAQTAARSDGRLEARPAPPSEDELRELEAFSLDRRQLRWLRQFYLKSPENREMALALARMTGDSLGRETRDKP